jgi:hypothetical protein
MSKIDVGSLQNELEQFRKEKEQIRAIVGEIGGKQSAKRDRIINVIFIIAIGSLFALDALHYYVPGFPSLLPELFSIEVAVLLVSIKIIWMIHKQSKVEHFQFWILSSIEYRVNHIAKRLNEIEELIEVNGKTAETS